jgi:hypothetical protein
MEGAPAFCANSMKIEAVETARIPPSRAREMVELRGVVKEEGVKGQEKSENGIGLSVRAGGIVNDILEIRTGILTWVKRSI